KIGLAPSGNNRSQMGQHFRLALLERLDNRGGLPHKNAAVPIKISGGNVFLRHFGRRLFAEAANLVNVKSSSLSLGERVRVRGCRAACNSIVGSCCKAPLTPALSRREREWEWDGQYIAFFDVTKRRGRIRWLDAKRDNSSWHFVNQRDRRL